MARYLTERMLQNYANTHYIGECCEKNAIFDAAYSVPKVDAIPVRFIMDFAKTHDPVYKSNLATLIRTYNKEVDDRDRIPDDLFEF